MKYTRKKYQHFDKITNALVEGVLNFSNLSLKEKCEILLLFEITGCVDDNISQILDDVEKESLDNLDITSQLIRHLVLIKYNMNLDERKGFIQYWLHDKNFKNEDIVATSAIFQTLFDDKELLTTEVIAYLKKWLLQQVKNIRSLVIRAWFPYYLELFEKDDDSKVVLREVLNQRNKNGSWRGNLDQTIRIGFALSNSKYFQEEKIGSTTDFILNRFLEKGVGINLTNSCRLSKYLFKIDKLQKDYFESILFQVKSKRKLTSEIKDIGKVLSRVEENTNQLILGQKGIRNTLNKEFENLNFLINRLTEEQSLAVSKILTDLKLIDDRTIDIDWEQSLLQGKIQDLIDNLEGNKLTSESVKEIKDKLNRSELAVKHKLKFVIPLIFLKYEGEIELSNKQKFPRNWNEWRNLLFKEKKTAANN